MQNKTLEVIERRELLAYDCPNPKGIGMSRCQYENKLNKTYEFNINSQRKKPN